MKSTICPDCEGDEFRPCAICYKAMTPDNIDTMTDDEVKSELDLRGIDPGASYWKMRSEIYARNFEESQNILNATNAALEEWKRLAGVYKQEARVLDSDLRDQMEITGRKEMELTKLRGEMRRMQQNIERLEGKGVFQA